MISEPTQSKLRSAPPVPRDGAPAETDLPADDAIEFVDADFSDVPGPGRGLLKLLAGVLLIGAIVTVVVLIRGGGGGDEAGAVATPEERLLLHLGGGTSPTPGRYQVARAGDSGAPAITLYSVRDTRDPDGAARACAVLAEAVLCPSTAPEWRSVLDAMGLSAATHPTNESGWVTAAAWMLGLDPSAIYRGEAAPSSLPTTIVLAVDAAVPGLDSTTLAESARAAVDHLGAGSALLVLAHTAQGWVPLAGLEDAADWGAATALLAGLGGASNASMGELSPPNAALAAAPPAVSPGRRQIHVIAVQGADAVSAPAASDLLPADEAPPPTEVGFSSIAVGGPPSEGLVRAAFAGNGRLYTLPAAAGLPSAVAAEVARLTGRTSPLEPPRVGRSADGAVAVRFFTPVEGGWQRNALHVAADGQAHPVTGAVWREAGEPRVEGSTPVPELGGGDWVDGRLATADPTGRSGLAVDRLRLTVDARGRYRFAAESSAFRPRVTVLAAGSGQSLGSESGEGSAELVLELEPGHYTVAVEADEPATGTYRVRATGSRRDDDAEANASTRRERRSERRSGREEAEPEAEEASTTTTLSDDMLRSTMRRVIPDMTECADGYHGAVSMTFTVERGGAVSRVNIEGDGLPGPAADCLRELVEGVRFSGYGGPLVSASYFAAF